MDAVAAAVVALLAVEESLRGEGATRYRVMRLLNSHPNYAYRTVQRLEKEGYVECVETGRGRRCRATLMALIKLYGAGHLVAERLVAKRLGLAPSEALRTVLGKMAQCQNPPRTHADFAGWLLTNIHMPEARQLLVQLMPELPRLLCAHRSDGYNVY